jgi:hypothetical protein
MKTATSRQTSITSVFQRFSFSNDLIPSILMLQFWSIWRALAGLGVPDPPAMPDHLSGSWPLFAVTLGLPLSGGNGDGSLWRRTDAA